MSLGLGLSVLDPASVTQGAFAGLTSATVSADGTTVTLVFSEAMTGSTGFSLSVGGAMTYSSGTGTATVVFTAASVIVKSAVTTLTYVPGNFKDASNNAFSALSGRAVTNNSTVAPDALANTQLYFPSNGTMYTTQGGTTPSTVGGFVGRWVSGKSGKSDASYGAGLPTLRSDGLDFTTANFSLLNVDTPYTATGNFTAWASLVIASGTETILPFANASDAFRLYKVSNQIASSKSDYTLIQTPYTQTGAVLVRWRRATNNHVFVKATGLAEIDLGAQTGDCLFGQVGSSQGSGTSGTGGTNRIKSLLLCNADLVTDSPSSVTNVDAWFSQIDGVTY